MKLTKTIAIGAAAALLGTLGVSVAAAETNSPSSTTTTKPAASAQAGKATQPRRLLAGAAAVAAKAIGIDTKTLAAELKTGKSIADVATEHHVDPSAVESALVQSATTKINAAESAGKLTSQRAQALEAKLPAAAQRFVDAKHPVAKARRAETVRKGVVLAAKTIGIAPKDLAAELKSGKTIADVATEHHVDPKTVIDAIVKAGDARIEHAKSAGKISSQRAQTLEQKLPDRVTKFVDDWHPKSS